MDPIQRVTYIDNFTGGGGEGGFRKEVTNCFILTNFFPVHKDKIVAIASNSKLFLLPETES